MVKINLITKKILDLDSGNYVFFISKDIPDEVQTLLPDAKILLKEYNFTGKEGSKLILPFVKGKKPGNLIFIGLGDKPSVEQYRRALGNLVRLAESNKFRSLVLELPKLGNKESFAKQTAIALLMAGYHFDLFITDKSSKTIDVEVNLLVKKEDLKLVQRGIYEGMSIAEGVNYARHLVDLPASSLYPEEFSRRASDVANKEKLKLTIWGQKKIDELGMGGLIAVSSGSNQEPQFIIMEYKYKDTAPTIGFVGKGITFDSGGLNLKPERSMSTMKCDMAGAAAVLSSMKVLSQLKPKVNIIAIMPLAENLPSGKSCKPGDIIKFYNGKTAEINNTDAEGRLILADALSYAVKNYKLDAIIDLATLTGACAYALGPFYSGLLSNNDEITVKVEKASEMSGDKVWRLPLDKDFEAAIKSSTADMSNTGSPKYLAGTITASFFLKNFVGDVPWVHLDIAGTAFDVPDISYYGPGATGAGVRLLVELAMNWKE